MRYRSFNSLLNRLNKCRTPMQAISFHQLLRLLPSRINLSSSSFRLNSYRIHPSLTLLRPTIMRLSKFQAVAGRFESEASTRSKTTEATTKVLRALAKRRNLTDGGPSDSLGQTSCIVTLFLPFLTLALKMHHLRLSSNTCQLTINSRANVSRAICKSIESIEPSPRRNS